jgi:hypothetical protein
MPGSWIDQMHAAANRTGHGFIHARVIRRMGDDALNFMTRSRAVIQKSINSHADLNTGRRAIHNSGYLLKHKMPARRFRRH